MSEVRVSFRHGLGDCVYFAHSIPLYLRRGHRVLLSCDRDKEFVFRSCGAELHLESSEYPAASYIETTVLGQPRRDFAHSSKPARNLGRAPMPELGDSQTLWDELVAVRLNAVDFISRKTCADVDSFIESMQHPIILVHTVGNSVQGSKSLSAALTTDLYQELLASTNGSLVLLDWHHRVPKLNCRRVRHLCDDWGPIDVETLVALILAADLLIGIDSGPFHLARFTNTPHIGVFSHPFHHPVRIALPHPQQLCLIPARRLPVWNRIAKAQFNLVEWKERELTAAFIAKNACEFLAATEAMPKK